MPLVRIPQAFDHPDILWEIKYDGFRALATVDDGHCVLTSRSGYVFNQWDALRQAIVRDVRMRSVVLDGEIVCLDQDGIPQFDDLLFRRAEPFFMAFDVLSLQGRDITHLPLWRRKHALRLLRRRDASRVRYVRSIREHGITLFDGVCKFDLEGVVGKWVNGTYQQKPGATSWVKVLNPEYTQKEGRGELFEQRRKDASPRAPLTLVWT